MTVSKCSQVALVAGALLLGVFLGAIGTFFLTSNAVMEDPSTGPAARFLRGSPLTLGFSRSNSAATDGKLAYAEAKLEPAPKVCVVAGVGPGIGENVARRFARGGCRVALLARNADKLANISQTIEGSKAYACDVTDPKQVSTVFSAIQTDLGDVDALIYNVGAGAFRPYDNITADTLEMDFKANALGLLLTSQQVGPKMAEHGHGVIGVTGATASWRGMGYTAGFAPGKFASRALAQSLARDLGHKGVHVFHAVIDGGVAPGTPYSKNTSMHPEDIAETYWNLALQPRSAWTFELSMFAWADTTWYSI